MSTLRAKESHWLALSHEQGPEAWTKILFFSPQQNQAWTL